ncbi:STAS domain-containing protein [Leptospira adleri]|uniref:Anti-anti-sigma factor n=1 Tax=Leptospira adleri TaxID=2023186 RepID=A0A2M9YUQ6_9LEPT|nr:STAS domain-containing protein [Leptospira adleri]PJZ55268.1 anti-anti-sigma factor [Leptospira adleri]PJZ62430.1 anti-anti-sigma factor [Leptospira adleri]
MEIRSRLSGNILKLKLKGKLDASSAEDFYSYLKAKWEEGIRKFLFSCEELEYIEAEGISVLARFENFLKNRGASSAYCAFNEECKTLLSFLGFGKTISFFEDPSRAEEYLSLIKIQDERSSKKESSPISRIKRNTPIQFYSSKETSASRSGFGGSQSVYIPEIRTVPESEVASSEDPKTEAKEVFNSEPGSPEHGLSSQSRRLEAFLQEEGTSSSMISSGVSKTEESSSSSETSTASYAAKSILDQAIQDEKRFPKRMIYCGACSSRIRVSKPGRYQCPACQIQFDLNAMGGVRYLEKLLGNL